jgi:hypothetical protein
MEGGDGLLMDDEKDFMFLPASLVINQQRRYDREKELAADRRVRYEKRHPERGGRGRHGKGHGAVLAINKEFICWDGEAPRDTDYSLFGNSKRMEICRPGPLRARECLDLIIATEIAYPDAIHISFGFNYDITQMLKSDLSLRKFNQLIHSGYCSWEGYRIRHRPGKWFDVSHGEVKCRIFDIRSFFEGGLVHVLEDWGIGPFASSIDVNNVVNVLTYVYRRKDSSRKPIYVRIPTVAELSAISESETVRIFKGLRSDFLWRDIESIRYYMRLELKYTIELMDRVRETLYGAGYLPNSWHGPGAIATLAIRRHGVYSAMAKCPEKVNEAARYAMTGGRFTFHLGGWADAGIWVYDLRSAYPYFCTKLPNLARGSWRYSGVYEPGKFAVYHIRYDVAHADIPLADKVDRFKIHPLFRRMPNGSVHYPPVVESWYWNPEAELVKDDPAATFLGGWIFDEDDETDRPFAWLATYFERKESAKRRGDRTGWVWKKIINAVFGQLARKSGWDHKSRTPPKSHQLEWAGWITSACRAAVYAAAIQAGDSLISIDTDGITCLAPLPNLDIGGNLGQWGEQYYEDGIFWQSGIYFLKRDGKWEKGEAKTRGIPRGTYTPEDLLNKLEETPGRFEDRALTMTKRLFITYRTARIRGWDNLGKWEDVPCKFIFGGHDKASHAAHLCHKHCVGMPGKMHRIGRRPISDYQEVSAGTIWSVPHKLPWLEETDPFDINEAEYYVKLSDQLDDDMLWVRTLADGI